MSVDYPAAKEKCRTCCAIGTWRAAKLAFSLL
jgi:hypothetical protein